MTDTDAHLIEEMFVQLAKGATVSDGEMTLVGASPSTLYFSDRPERVVGHMTTEQFVVEWNEGTDSFASDPPNAVLSFVEPGDDTPSDVVMVLRDPTIGEDSITYAVDVLDGELPARPGRAPCSSTHSAARCPPSPLPACTAAIGAEGAAASEYASRRQPSVRDDPDWLYPDHRHKRSTRGGASHVSVRS